MTGATRRKELVPHTGSLSKRQTTIARPVTNAFVWTVAAGRVTQRP